MDKTYFDIYNDNGVVTLSNRIPFVGKESLSAFLTISITISVVFLYAAGPLSIVMGLITGLIFSFLYTIYRFSAWFWYTHTVIDHTQNTLVKTDYFLDQKRRSTLIDKNYDYQKMRFVSLKRGGKEVFILRYRTRKEHDLFIIRTEADKEYIEEMLEV